MATPLPRDPTVLADYGQRPFQFAGETRTVYTRGEGPGVIVMAEVPGITPKVVEFADRVVERGFRVWLPDLFGEPGRPPSPLYMGQIIAKACVAREFTVLSRGQRSRVTEWLRALARAMHAERPDDPGVGAVGMCLTGNFALAMALDPCMQAPVLSQPSLPFAITPAHAGAVHLDPGELERVAARCREEDLTVLGLRFTHDFMCPARRFASLRESLGPHFEGIEIDSSRGNPHGNPLSAHSVLTEHLVDEDGHPTRRALDRVLELFEAKLRPTGQAHA